MTYEFENEQYRKLRVRILKQNEDVINKAIEEMELKCLYPKRVFSDGQGTVIIWFT